MLKLGNKNISKFYLGNKGISKAYLGTNLVFESAKPIFIDYIESTGTQWLDTGLYLDSYRMVIEAQGTETPKNNYTILCSHLRDYAGCALFVYNKFWGLQAVALTSVSIFERTKLDATFDIVGGYPHAALTINGDTIEYQRTNTPPYSRHTIQIFSSKASTSAYKEFIGKVFGFEIYDLDGNLLMNAKPCIHPKTFEACMYDMVSKKYLYNQGTGEFIPAPIFVEYIESDSTAYIDTGVSGNNDKLSLNMTFYVENFFEYGSIFGNYIDEDTNAFRVICSEYSNRLYLNANTKARNATLRNIADNFYGSKHTLRLEKTQLTIDGVSSPVNNINGTVNDTNIALFNRSVANPVPNVRDIGLKIYSCQMYDGDVIIRDFRPCLQGNTPCLYDMVTGQYFYNQGTGEFEYSE